jgi:hypothetical protein
MYNWQVTGTQSVTTYQDKASKSRLFLILVQGMRLGTW